MIERNFSRVLSAVNDLAVEVINRPASVGRYVAIADLTETVDRERAVMVEGGNPIGAEASILLEVLAHIEAERTIGSDRSLDFGMVAGVLLMMVRKNIVRAMALELRRPSTTDHDFAPRGKS